MADMMALNAVFEVGKHLSRKVALRAWLRTSGEDRLIQTAGTSLSEQLAPLSSPVAEHDDSVDLG